MPDSPEAYYQQIGRAGRDGEPADTLLLYGGEDIARARHWLSQSAAPEAQQRVMRERLEAMIQLTETTGCRTRALLRCFGEELGAECGHCDTCRNPVSVVDGTVAAQKVLSAIYRTGQMFGALHIVSVLRGEKTAMVEKHGHDKLPTWGIGADQTEGFWRGVIRQLVALGALRTASGSYASLELVQDTARPILRRETTVMLRDEPDRPKRSSRAPRSPAATGTDLPANEPGFEALRAWRGGGGEAAGRAALCHLPRQRVARGGRRPTSHPRATGRAAWRRRVKASIDMAPPCWTWSRARSQSLRRASSVVTTLRASCRQLPNLSREQCPGRSVDDAEAADQETVGRDEGRPGVESRKGRASDDGSQCKPRIQLGVLDVQHGVGGHVRAEGRRSVDLCQIEPHTGLEPVPIDIGKRQHRDGYSKHLRGHEYDPVELRLAGGVQDLIGMQPGKLRIVDWLRRSRDMAHDSLLRRTFLTMLGRFFYAKTSAIERQFRVLSDNSRVGAAILIRAATEARICTLCSLWHHLCCRASQDSGRAGVRPVEKRRAKEDAPGF